MPKRVDHDERRRHIAAAVARIAATEGLGGVSFREVATEAEVSVSLVQHYFGNKERLLVDTLNIQSVGMGARILGRLEGLADRAGPLERVKVVAASFIPDDEESVAAMLVYLGFAGAALTDPHLRSADAFANGRTLLAFLTAELSAGIDAGDLDSRIEPQVQATAILSLVLGLSLSVLLGQISSDAAFAVLDAHLSLIARG